MDTMENVFEQLLAASGSSTVKESLECLIDTAKTSDGRLDLACKHIVVLVLRLCQSPPSAEELFLSIKLLRNLCAGEMKNQDLFIHQNGVTIILALINSMGFVSSSSDNRTLHMVLQLLGNVSLAGEQLQGVIWREMFPFGFMDIARVQSKETCDTLSMVIYTCVEGSNKSSVELLGDAGLDIVVEIIRTVTIVGYKEHWVKLLLFKICFEDSYFSPLYSKLSPVAEDENSDMNVAGINSFGAEQALLLSILAEILNQQLGDIVVSNEFPLFLFKILRNVVGVVDFSTRGKSHLPTGSADVDIMGYSLSLLRDISACQGQNVKNQGEDAVDMLVSAGLVKFLIRLLRDLEPPAIIRKGTVDSNKVDDSTSKYQSPYIGFRKDLVAIIGNCSYRRKHVQDEIREQDGILLLLQQNVTDEDSPFLREWGIWSMRNVFEGNEENQKLVAQLELQRSVDTPEITEMGLRVEIDPKTQRPKLVNA
ncbi:ataxin-10 [Salvia divinorum]|uniref:Ataxin-10 n=1 Tax=Salvia divinorum TaxID=28513 RepID=A0ABD1HAJ7_SALDI